jgi:uncharacterized protein (TIGR02600 family)
MELRNSGKRILSESSENPIVDLMTDGIQIRRPRVMPIATPHRSRAEGGAALIIVLTCLVLVAGLAIALLNRVEADRSSSGAYKGGANSRNLSEYAVNVVMAQIASATTGANAGNAWASQPGAIRVYANNAATLVNIYKLYSSPQMVTGTFPTSDTSPTGWTNSPALYTDLNAPLVSWSGTNQVTNYPILDPSAQGVVQGFTNVIVSGINSASTPAPMPVTWLYVLQDGSLVAPTGSGSTATVTVATKSNPITGRIAFWTDDETCKVNINTAAGMPWNWATNNPNSGKVSLTAGGTASTTLFGSYWDTPVIGSYQDLMLTWAPPWKGECQRYPGHPATVSLSAVFTNLATNDIMKIAPRINDQSSSSGSGGSQWGTVTNTYSGSGPNTNTIPSDGARLYANVDELLYATNRSATGTNPLTATQINQGRFFLTASSRAPDVTLFNTPRICIWPLWSTASMRTPLDTRIALASTLNSIPYYFTRSQPYSATADYSASTNTTLMGYLRRMTTTAVPGFGGSLGILGKYNTLMTGESEQILTEIFDYIRCINLRDQQTGAVQYASNSALVVPTIGTGTGAGTMGFGRMPTVTKAGLLFWYDTNAISDTIHTFYYTTTPGAPGTATSNTTSYTVCARLVLENFIPAQGNPGITNAPAFSNVVTGLNGFQWAQPASGIAATPIFANTTTNFNLMNMGTGTGTSGGGVGSVPGGRLNINASSADSGASNTTVSPKFVGRYFTNSGGTLYFKGNGAPGLADTNVAYTGSVIASNNAWYKPGGGLISVGTTNAYFTNAWYSNSTITTNYNGTFDLTGATLTITTKYGNTPIQTINNLTFPAVTGLPLPIITTTTNTLNGASAWTNFNRNAIPFGNGKDAIQTNDVVRAMQVTSGDFRMTAALTNVPAARFSTHPSYLTPTVRCADSFAGGAAGNCVWSTLETSYYNSGNILSLNKTGNPFGAANDMVVNSIGGGPPLLQYGDFDNGYGVLPDGPYIGLCDEGVLNNTTANPGAFGAYPYFLPIANTGINLLVCVGPGYYSPNRLVPSAGILGSLPTGVKGNLPWQTLLFRPAALTAAGHPGANTPPDYLLLDLFKMPVVEPYAISEPLSTAGQVNMNYQILPFTWIKRSTAVQAALHTEMITAIPNTMPGGIDITKAVFKKAEGVTTATTRYPLNLSTNNGTLVGFENRFATNGIFVSASEICSIPLVPTNSTYAYIASWWNSYTYTGENSKERPYARIYPKLTTKSNVYTVHYTVQALKKLPSGTQNQWDETKDKVLSTYRGSTTIERYVNPRDSSIPDYTGVTLPLSSSDPNALPYKFRILSQRQFSP